MGQISTWQTELTLEHFVQVQRSRQNSRNRRLPVRMSRAMSRVCRATLRSCKSDNKHQVLALQRRSFIAHRYRCSSALCACEHHEQGQTHARTTTTQTVDTSHTRAVRVENSMPLPRVSCLLLAAACIATMATEERCVCARGTAQLASQDSPDRGIYGTLAGVCSLLVLGLTAPLVAGYLRRRKQSALVSEAGASDRSHAERDSAPAAPRLGFAYEVEQLGWLKALVNWPSYPASDAARAAALARESASRAAPDSAGHNPFGSALELDGPPPAHTSGQAAWPPPSHGIAGAQPAGRQAEADSRPAAIDELVASADAFDS